MVYPNPLMFKSLVLDPLTSEPIYKDNEKDLILCEVYTGLDDGSLDKVYISTKSLMMIGALPEKIIISLNLSPDEGMVMSPLLQENKDELNPYDTNFEFKEGDHVSGYYWSSRHVTCEDIDATVKFLNLVTSQGYSELFKNPSIQNYIIWQQIATDMSSKGFVVAKNAVEGGKICQEMWAYLKRTFDGIEESFNISDTTTTGSKRKLATLLQNKQKKRANNPLPNIKASVEEKSVPNMRGHLSAPIPNNTSLQGNDNNMNMLDSLIYVTRQVKEIERESINELSEEESAKCQERLKTIQILEDYLNTEAKKRKKSH